MGPRVDQVSGVERPRGERNDAGGPSSDTETLAVMEVRTLFVRLLTLFCLVDHHILIDLISPFPVLGVSGAHFPFYSSLDGNSFKQTVATLITTTGFCTCINSNLFIVVRSVRGFNSLIRGLFRLGP